jgi:aryl-alcohol dehydrogenase-like predicted oxidoreductase
MKYVQLGNSGLKVSQLCLGCMSYGLPERGTHTWTLDEEKSRPFVKKALEVGINFFDTANVYSDGTSEEIVGRALRDFSTRDAIVLATKVNGVMRKGDANGRGLSRKAILTEIDHSLRRLGTDYVDLYQIHRWDYQTPIEETLEALHDVVKSGKARYIGASSMFAWQFAKSLYLATQNGWTRFISMQNHYNLLYREEEREMMPLCVAEQIGVIPWSPLARGRLTRPWVQKGATQRGGSDQFGDELYDTMEEANRAVVDRVEEVARARGIPQSQVALAWHFTKPYVTAPIIGATKPGHLEDAIAALEMKLSPEEVARLEEAYIPHPVLGFE